MAKNKQRDPEGPETQQYIVVYPVRHEGRPYQRRDVLWLTAEQAAGWLKSGYIAPVARKSE